MSAAAVRRQCFDTALSPEPLEGAIMNSGEQLSAPCPVCESTDTRQARVRSAFWHNDCLVVIEEVPALVCNTCGEQFYDDAAVHMIDQMRANGFPPEDAVRELRVPVFSFGKTASSEMSSEMSM
ncbi:MAG TPA: type II toxin-antitoxin system MqsA family antitoxin [Xanthobacteraceae bacterium]|nr:type II toxin-antitoxin system MqsA family antitoxin [Xanthobacteraceae bacterium]